MPAISLSRFTGDSYIGLFAFKHSDVFLIQNTPQLSMAVFKTGAL